MENIVQTSGFELSESEALRLLRHFPLMISTKSSPSLLYRIDSELLVGGEVSYRLVDVFQIVNWKGVITSVNGSSWTADIKQGPFHFFHAKHSIAADNGFLEISDEFEFETDSLELSNALKSSRILYAFDARAALSSRIDSFESRRQTETFQAFKSGLSAG